jgi:ribosomal protein S18 acetylase RimI-like enzyme
VLGRRDYTDVEVANDLRRADAQAWGWFDPSGRLVAYGWLSQVEGSEKVQVDAYVHPSYDAALGFDVLGHLESIGLELVEAAGHDAAVFDTGVYRQDEKTREWMRARGYSTPTVFVRMRVDLDEPVEQPDPGSGVRVRRSDRSPQDLRIAHRIDEDSFTEHYGHVPTSFESWQERLVEPGDDWAEVWLADLDGEPSGALVGTRQFVEEENAGYVRTLGTLPAARGRGVAKALLRAYFAACRDAGRAAVLLHVDVANVTGALALYESVGMRRVLEIDAWTKRATVRLDR